MLKLNQRILAAAKTHHQRRESRKIESSEKRLTIPTLLSKYRNKK